MTDDRGVYLRKTQPFQFFRNICGEGSARASPRPDRQVKDDLSISDSHKE